LVQDDITSLGEKSVKTASGEEYPCDVLILCHGFKADTFYYPLKGRNGITPEKHWEVAGGPSSYKGTAMHGFPNFFAIRGPNVSSG
jgi:cation diffusion facilitator CzcD-associated flavoprotein CzcO